MSTYTAACSQIGSFTYAKYFTLYVVLSENTVETANNRSKVTYHVYCQSSGSGSLNAYHTLVFTLNGSTIINSNKKIVVSSPKACIEIASGTTGYIGHNSDGSKSISFSASIKAGSYGVSASKSGTFTLTKIARYFTSTPGLSLTSKTETTQTFKWSTSETCSSIEVYKAGSLYATWGVNATSGSFNVTGLNPNTSYSVYVKCKRSDSGLFSSSGTTTNSTYNYPYITGAPSFTIGNAFTLTYYNPLGRTLTMSGIGANGSTIFSGTTNGTSITGFNDSGSIARQYASIPTAQSGSYTIRTTCSALGRTIDGGGATYYINTSACVPTIPEVTPFDNGGATGYTNNDSIFIKSKSNLGIRIKTHSTAKNGAYIKSYSVAAGNQSATYYRDEDITKYSGLTFGFNNIASQTYTIKVTDSRGMTNTQTYTLDNWKTYFTPYFSSISAERSDGGVGEGVSISFVGAFWNQWFGAANTSVYNANKLIVAYKYRTNNGGYNSYVNFTNPIGTALINSGAANSFKATIDIPSVTFSVENTYAIKLRVTDGYSTVESPEIAISAGNPGLAIWGNKIAVGKRYTTLSGIDKNLQVHNDMVIIGDNPEICLSTSDTTNYNVWKKQAHRIGGASGSAGWFCIGSLTTHGDNTNTIIDIIGGNGYNGSPSQNSRMKIQIKDGWQSTQSVNTAMGITCDIESHDSSFYSNFKIKVIATSSTNARIWVYFPIGYWNGHCTIEGVYSNFTFDGTFSTSEPAVGDGEALQNSAVYVHQYTQIS